MTAAPDLASAEPAPPELVAAIQAAKAEVSRRERELTEHDGMLFKRVFFPDDSLDESPEFHYEMMRISLKEPGTEDIWREMEGAVYAAPRGFAKSTIVSMVVPVYVGCHRKKHFVVLISNTDTQADLLAESIRKQFEENDHLKEVFGELRGDRFLNGPLRWVNQDFTIAHTNPPGSLDRRHIVWTTRYISRGMLVRIRGAKARHRRPDLLILDDCENDENVQTPEQRDKVWNFFTKSLLPMLDPHSGYLLVVGTVLHFDSLLARLLSDKYGSVYIRRIWKAIQDGVSLWPARWPLDRLARLRRQITGRAWACTPAESPILMADWTEKPISEIRAGDAVMGFVPYGHGPHGTGRARMVPTKVTAIHQYVGRVQKMTMSNGATVRCTPDHKWYAGRGVALPTDTHRAYLPAKAQNDRRKGGTWALRRVVGQFAPPTAAQEGDWRYLAGILDGEGHCRSWPLDIAQSATANPEVHAEIGRVLDRLGIPYNLRLANTKSLHCDKYVLSGGRDTIVRILRYSRPAKTPYLLRGLTKWSSGMVGKAVDNVIAIEPQGEEPIYALTTETGNYVAWGYASSNSEMDNNPVDEEARKYRPEWLQWYRGSDLDSREGVLYAWGMPLRIVMGVDAAIEEEEDRHSDESVIVILGVTPDRRVLVLWVWHARVDFPTQVQRILQAKKDWKVSLAGMEKPAYQRALSQQVFLESRRSFTGIRGLKNQAPKYERISAASIAAERGKLYLRAAEECSCGVGVGAAHDSDCIMESSEKWDDTRRVRVHGGSFAMYDQLTKFPSDAHDDLPDALCNGLQVVVGRQGFEDFF